MDLDERKPKSTIQAEGKAHNEDTAKANKPAKAKSKPKTENVFPTDAKINDYGFLGFKKSWLDDLNWTKGMALKIEKNADGSITLKKA